MDKRHPSDSGCVVSFSFMACSGQHISLRLLSLHSCNEYLSLTKKNLLSQQDKAQRSGQLCSHAARRKYSQRHPEKPIGRGKTAQLSIVVSSSASKAESGKQEALHKKGQKPAAWTSYPWTQEKLVQSANLCFQWNKLQWHTLHIGYPSTASAEKNARVRPFPCPLT